MEPFTPRDPAYAERVRASFARQGVMAHIGAELAAVRPGFCEIRLRHRLELTQQHGYFHAGVTATIGDSAGGYAGYSLMPAGSSVLTVEFKLNLLAPADGELLIARGRVLKPGRTLTVTEIDVAVVKDGDERRCATGLQTLICLADRADGQSG